MKKNKTKIIIKIILFVITVAIICGGFILFSKEDGKNFSNSTQNIIRKTFADIFYSEKEEIEKDNKAYNEALKYKNNNWCKLIANSEKQQECIDAIIMLEAIETKNFEKCNEIKIENDIQECNQKIIEITAIEKLNKNLCNAILDTNKRMACKDSIDSKKLSQLIHQWNITKQKCEELDNNFRTECIKEINIYQIDEEYINTIDSKNIAKCSNLDDENLKKSCQEKILYNRAIEEKNAVLCEYINNDEQKNYCRKKTLINIDSSILDNAIKNNNIKECDNLADISLREICNDIIIFKTVKITKNTNLCKQIKNKKNIETCKLIKE